VIGKDKPVDVPGISEDLWRRFLGIGLSDLKTDTANLAVNSGRRCGLALSGLSKKDRGSQIRLAAQAQAQPADEAGIKKTLRRFRTRKNCS